MGQVEIVERAIAKAGSGRALARLLDKAEPRISHWKKGTEPIPDDALAVMASYIGEDPIAALATAKGGLWSKVRATAVTTALVVTLLPIALPFGTADFGQMYIMSTRLRAILRRIYSSSLLRLRTTVPHPAHLVASSKRCTTANATS